MYKYMYDKLMFRYILFLVENGDDINDCCIKV